LKVGTIVTKYIKKAKDMGVKDAKIIAAKTIVTA